MTVIDQMTKAAVARLEALEKEADALGIPPEERYERVTPVVVETCETLLKEVLKETLHSRRVSKAVQAITTSAGWT